MKINLKTLLILLKEVIEIYPNTSSFLSAKIGLKEVSVKKGSVDEYLDYISRIPQLDISVSSKDSLSFQVATITLNRKNIQFLKLNLKNYLSVI